MVWCVCGLWSHVMCKLFSAEGQAAAHFVLMMVHYQDSSVVTVNWLRPSSRWLHCWFQTTAALSSTLIVNTKTSNWWKSEGENSSRVVLVCVHHPLFPGRVRCDCYKSSDNSWTCQCQPTKQKPEGWPLAGVVRMFWHWVTSRRHSRSTYSPSWPDRQAHTCLTGHSGIDGFRNQMAGKLKHVLAKVFNINQQNENSALTMSASFW